MNIKSVEVKLSCKLTTGSRIFIDCTGSDPNFNISDNISALRWLVNRFSEKCNVYREQILRVQDNGSRKMMYCYARESNKVYIQNGIDIANLLFVCTKLPLSFKFVNNENNRFELHLLFSSYNIEYVNTSETSEIDVINFNRDDIDYEILDRAIRIIVEKNGVIEEIKLSNLITLLKMSIIPESKYNAVKNYKMSDSNFGYRIDKTSDMPVNSLFIEID